MRPYNDYIDELDNIDDFDVERSRAFHKMLDDYRREERNSHDDHHLDRFKGRRHHVNWNWEDDDDWD